MSPARVGSGATLTFTCAMDSTTGKTRPEARKRLLAASRGSLREAFESLPMSAQFRLTAFAVVTATVLAVQFIGALWDTWSARSEAIDLARAKTTSMAVRLQAAGGGALDRLDARPQFLAATFSLQSGEVLQRYVRGADDGSDAPNPRAAPDWTTRPKGVTHAVKAVFALEPIFVGSPVELGGGLTGTVSILVDHRWIWNHAWRRLVQAQVEPLVIGHRSGVFGAEFPGYGWNETVAVPADISNRPPDLFSYRLNVTWQQGWENDQVSFETLLYQHPPKQKKASNEQK